MYCKKCGSRIEDDSNFCPECGAKLSTDLADLASSTADKVASTIDSVVDETGKQIDSTVENLKSSAKTAAKISEDKLNDLGHKVSGFDYTMLLEKDMVDKISATACILPLFYAILCKIIGILFALCFGLRLYFLVHLFSFILKIIRLFSLGVIIGGLGLNIYRIAKFKESTVMSLLQTFGTAAALLSICTNGFISFISGLLALVIGADIAINIFIKKQPVSGDLDIDGDITAAREFLNNKKMENAYKAAQENEKSNCENEKSYVNPEPAVLSEASYFDGTGGQAFVNILIYVLVSAVTCGIASPWFLVKITRWKTEHMVINGRRLQFNGTGGQLWGLWIKWWLLSIITCGIYIFFATVDYYKWIARHTSFADETALDGTYPGSLFDGNSFEYIGYSILTSLLNVVTCGIASPWTMCIMTEWYYKSFQVSNKRLVFDGKGGQVFWKLIGWSLLCMITCGIYTPWAICKLNQFVLENLHIDSRYTA